jgi:hypothetical protein
MHQPIRTLLRGVCFVNRCGEAMSHRYQAVALARR